MDNLSVPLETFLSFRFRPSCSGLGPVSLQGSLQSMSFANSAVNLLFNKTAIHAHRNESMPFLMF